jgi:hypothetical protein
MSSNWVAVCASVGALVLLAAGGWLAVRFPGPVRRVLNGILVLALSPFGLLVLVGLVMSACGRLLRELVDQAMRGR